MKRSRIIQLICLGVTLGVFITFIVVQKNKDSNPPEIIIDKDSIEASIEDGDDVLLAGVTAKDDEDGDLTDQIFIERIDKIQEGENNQFTINYVVYDKADNMTRASRTLYYTDYHQPHIIISQPLRFNITVGQIYLRDYITVEDCIDGDISSHIWIKGEENLIKGDLTEGEVKCEIIAQNSLNDEVCLPITVEIYSDNYEEAVKPRIVLSDYVWYIKKGTTFNAFDNVQEVYDMGKNYYNIGKTPAKQTAVSWVTAAQVPFVGSVDVNVPGIYNGYYTYTSRLSGITVQCKCYVIIE